MATVSKLAASDSTSYFLMHDHCTLSELRGLPVTLPVAIACLTIYHTSNAGYPLSSSTSVTHRRSGLSAVSVQYAHRAPPSAAVSAAREVRTNREAATLRRHAPPPKNAAPIGLLSPAYGHGGLRKQDQTKLPPPPPPPLVMMMTVEATVLRINEQGPLR